MRQSWLVAAAVCLLAAEATRVSPVQKVVMLIDDMAGKVTKDLDAAASAFTESSKFCDDEMTQKGYAIKGSKDDIEKLSAVNEDESAKIVEFATKIEDLSGEISGVEGELGRAVGLRKKERNDFIAVEKELVETVERLDGATETLKKSLSLAQLSPTEKAAFKAALQGISAVVDASFFTHAQKSKVQAFLQAQEDSDESSRGGGDAIIDTLKEMTDKAEGTLGDARGEETEASHAHAMLKGGMENQIKSYKEELGESTHGKQTSTEVLAKSEKDLAITKKALREDTGYVADLKHECMIKAQEWEIDTRDGNAELKALNMAKNILVKKFASLMETRVASHRVELAVAMHSHQDGDTNKARALRLIQELGRRLHSTPLVALAYRAAADPFVKIRGMIEDMIAKLLQEAAEEASQKAFCDEELGKSNKLKETKQMKLDKTNTRIEKSESATAELTGQVTVLSKEIAEIDAAVTEATAIREKEKTEFLKVEKDFSESQEACAAALEVLREYYEGASLVQTGTELKSKESTSEQGDGSGIIALLELAESDFAKLLADARSAEEVSADEFNKMTQENKLAKATKEMEVKGKQSELKSIKTTLSDLNEDKGGLSTELDAVLEYLDKLKPQCETKVPTYAEKKARREQEIAGLKEALSVLEA